ncbi:MAG TPA: DUF402 domain-containing protein [Caulobacteraceae bacterium]
MGAMVWNPGDEIVVRHVWRETVWFAHPAIVVEDTPARLAVFEPVGAVRQWSHFDFERGLIAPPCEQRRHSTDALILIEAGAAHAVSLFWREGGGPFLCWYVDMQAPFRRAGGGVVTWDQALDVVVAPDLRWTWKDEDHVARMPSLGWITPDEAAAVRREGRRVIERIERREFPFSEPWPTWRPDPSWPIPVLPNDWATPC